MIKPETSLMLRDNALAGKNIVVTGGGTGLGRSMTKTFLQLGARVLITSRKEEVLKNTCAELEKETGGFIRYAVCDVRKMDEVEAAIEKAWTELGPVNVWVNNAAGNFISPTERLSHKAFDTIVDIVLKGSYNCTLAVGKRWIAEKIEGSFLNIVTTYAWTGSGYVVPSATAKAGVLALTRSLAVEWAKYGIRSNAIAPGPFPTEGAWSRLFPEELAKKIDPLARIPLKRFGEHPELGNLAAFLVSDFANFMNGEVVTIDGGEWLQGGGEFNNLEHVPAPMWDIIEKAVRGK
ncbi:MAG TPA: SDR family oxidoreductase [Flavobacteriales bacterium]|jgi:NAD(P)-dependent dehydrogenase (short-subunit alcohol dehydrogenase family)|nr:SDR family oxidoreductase [Flavobacteriales bacterium]HPH83168.1 SDR family oxidoreductase [Flavobacteriales bacterium]